MISSPVNGLDLRGTPCPLNYVRCRLALEELAPGDSLQVFLDKGEPEEMVVSGLIGEGHNVEVIKEDFSWVKLMVICSDS
tara:strand:+ start:1826 stop:2065 length:240 start_codon:yes stop_codon:yes gene_type:complete